MNGLGYRNEGGTSSMEWGQRPFNGEDGGWGVGMEILHGGELTEE